MNQDKTEKTNHERAVPLTPAQRKEYNASIARRQKNILQSLDYEMRGDVESIAQNIRRDNGIAYKPEQLEQLISNLDSQIEDLIEENNSETKQEISIQMEELNESFNERLQTIKNNYRNETARLEEKFRADKLVVEEKFRADKLVVEEEQRKKNKELKDSLKNSRDLTAEQFAFDLVAEKKKFTNELAKTRAVEISMQSEILKRSTLIKNNKERLKMMISDTAGQAMEKLMTVSTTVQAQELVNSIPTVGEALTMISSEDGMMKLFLRLDPNTKALPDFTTPAKDAEKPGYVVVVSNPNRDASEEAVDGEFAEVDYDND